MKISQHNLDDAEFFIDGAQRKNEITAQCKYCQETVTQRDAVCPGCGAHVVWHNSIVWKREWGRPDLYLHRLMGDELKGRTPLELLIIGRYGRDSRFSNKTQQTQFLRAQKKYPDDYIKHVFEWARSKRIPWSGFIGAIENQSWFEEWGQKEMEAVNAQQRATVSDEELSNMLS